MSGYNLFSQLMSYFNRYSTCFNVFIPRPVTTSFDRFFCGFLRLWSTVLAFWSFLGPDRFAVLPKKAIGERPDRTLKHYFKRELGHEMHPCLELLARVSRSGPVRFFSLFWTRPGPVRSSEISFLGKNRTGLGKTGLHRSGLRYLSTLNRLRPRPV